MAVGKSQQKQMVLRSRLSHATSRQHSLRPCQMVSLLSYSRICCFILLIVGAFLFVHLAADMLVHPCQSGSHLIMMNIFYCTKKRSTIGRCWRVFFTSDQLYWVSSSAGNSLAAQKSSYLSILMSLLRQYTSLCNPQGTDDTLKYRFWHQSSGLFQALGALNSSDK